MQTTVKYASADQDNNVQPITKNNADGTVTQFNTMLDEILIATTVLYASVHQDPHALPPSTLNSVTMTVTGGTWIMDSATMNKDVGSANVNPGSQGRAVHLTQLSVMQDVKPPEELELRAWIPRQDVQPVNVDAGQ